MFFDPNGPGLRKGPSLEDWLLQRLSREQTDPPNQDKIRIINSTLMVTQYLNYPRSQLTIQVLSIMQIAHSWPELTISHILYRYL